MQCAFVFFTRNYPAFFAYAMAVRNFSHKSSEREGETMDRYQQNPQNKNQQKKQNGQNKSQQNKKSKSDQLNKKNYE